MRRLSNKFGEPTIRKAKQVTLYLFFSNPSFTLAHNFMSPRLQATSGHHRMLHHCMGRTTPHISLPGSDRQILSPTLISYGEFPNVDLPQILIGPGSPKWTDCSQEG